MQWRIQSSQTLWVTGTLSSGITIFIIIIILNNGRRPSTSPIDALDEEKEGARTKFQILHMYLPVCSGIILHLCDLLFAFTDGFYIYLDSTPYIFSVSADWLFFSNSFRLPSHMLLLPQSHRHGSGVSDIAGDSWRRGILRKWAPGWGIRGAHRE